MKLRTVKWLIVAYVLLDFLAGYAGFVPMLPAAAAQFTTVTGTVTDPNGLPYAGGTITATLVLPGGTSATLSGFPYSPPTQPTGLNITGKFLLQLADNTVLLPAATKWNFTVCSAQGTIQPAGGKGSVCFTLAAPITISGASQDISANLNAVALALSSTSTTFPLLGTDGTTSNPTYSFTNAPNTGMYLDSGHSQLIFATGANDRFGISSTGVILPNAAGYNWGATPLSASRDTSVQKITAGIVGAGQGNANPDTTGSFAAASFQSRGTKFTTNGGCGETSGTTTGGATVGKFTTSGTTSCTTIITMGASTPAPFTGYDCHAVDLTTAADFANPHQSASTTTTVTIVSGTIVASDVIQFSCFGY